jgi:RIO kinase 1
VPHPHGEQAAPTTDQTGRSSGLSIDTLPDAPPEGTRWTTWDSAQHGPGPRPDWVVTALGAVDEDLGVLKTGKEADVHVVRRRVPGADGATGSDVVMAAKRFRAAEHRMFHRDSGYLEGRRVRKSREMRAMARRTDFGKEMISAQWAGAEFGALSELWALDLPVPYPVQLHEGELLLEFIGDPETGEAAPRLSGARPPRELLPDLFEQARSTMLALAGAGWAHGDLSAYNILLDGERLVVIDWPQVVDIIGNPRGPEYLERDCRTVCAWFRRKGLAVDEDELFGDLMAEAVSRW